MKELVELLAKNIVSQPKAVSVEESKADTGEVVMLSVAASDMGKVIGKAGRVIKAMRTLLKIKAIQEGRHVYLELVEQKLNRDQAPETSNQ